MAGGSTRRTGWHREATSATAAAEARLRDRLARPAPARPLELAWAEAVRARYPEVEQKPWGGRECGQARVLLRELAALHADAGPFFAAIVRGWRGILDEGWAFRLPEIPEWGAFFAHRSGLIAALWRPTAAGPNRAPQSTAPLSAPVLAAPAPAAPPAAALPALSTAEAVNAAAAEDERRAALAAGGTDSPRFAAAHRESQRWFNVLMARGSGRIFAPVVPKFPAGTPERDREDRGDG